MRRRKYRPGRPVHSVNDLLCVLRAGWWVYLRGKAYHPAWVWQLSLETLAHAVRDGWINVAVENKGEKA